MGKGAAVYMCDIAPGQNGSIRATLRYAHNGEPALVGTLFYCLDQLARGEFTLVAQPKRTVTVDEAVTDEPWGVDIQF